MSAATGRQPCRKALAPLLGQRLKFVAVFRGTITRPSNGVPRPFLLLEDIRHPDADNLLADHLILLPLHRWAGVRQSPALVRFEATVCQYFRRDG